MLASTLLSQNLNMLMLTKRFAEFGSEQWQYLAAGGLFVHVRILKPSEISEAVQIFVTSAGKIQERGYMTLYELMTKNKKGAVARIVLSFSKPYQV